MLLVSYALARPSDCTPFFSLTLPAPRSDQSHVYDKASFDSPGETNKHRYVLAAQSLTLRQTLQPIAGLPIIHFNARAVLVLSPPSTATIRHKNAVEESKRTDQLAEMGDIVDGGNVVGASAAGPSSASSQSALRPGAADVRARKKVKGPNPLSVRKKKSDKEVKKDAEVQLAEKKERKKRSRKVDTEVELEPELELESEGGAAVAQDGSGKDDETGRRKKKRKRGKGKGAVAEARAELSGMNGGDAGGSGSESDS